MHELAVVMPVYNEAECIEDVVAEWLEELAHLGIDHRLIVIDDGSTDDTWRILQSLEGRPGLELVRKPNSGHGPTILVGYRRACDIAEWVFQCDSDDEMPADAFARLWDEREGRDAVMGVRWHRHQDVSRFLITRVSRAAIALLYRRGVRDVNAPFRLIRAAALRCIVDRIPDDTFAPNLVISGVLAATGARILNVDVPHHSRRTGTVSIVRWSLWKAAARAGVQTIALRRLARECRGSGGPASEAV